jgi:hypothetical protein
MTVHMDVDEVRTGGTGLRGLAPNGQTASRRVERPATTAAERNRGFPTGDAGGGGRGAGGRADDEVERESFLVEDPEEDVWGIGKDDDPYA